MTDTYRHRYRLPASLGGGEYEGVVNGSYVLLNVPDVGAVPFAAAVVTRIVPAEPEDESWVVVIPEGGDRPFVWSRHDDELGETPGASHWWWHDKQQWCRWDEVYTLGIPRRMIFGGLIARTGGVRGLCAVCKSMVPLRVDNKLKLHGSKYARCKGSQTHPAEGGAS